MTEHDYRRGPLPPPTLPSDPETPERQREAQLGNMQRHLAKSRASLAGAPTEEEPDDHRT